MSLFRLYISALLVAISLFSFALSNFGQKGSISNQKSETGDMNAVSINDVVIKKCHQQEFFGLSSSHSVTSSSLSRIPLCFWVKNHHEDDIIIDTELRTLNQSGQCTTDLHPVGFYSSENYNLIETGMTYSGGTTFSLSGNEERSIYFHIDHQSLTGLQSLNGCFSFFENNRLSDNGGMFKIKIVQVRETSIMLTGEQIAEAQDYYITPIIPTGPKRTYEVHGSNLVKNDIYHLSYHDGEYQLAFTVTNNSTVFSRFVLSGVLNTMLTSHPLYAEYSLPPGSSNPIIYRISDNIGSIIKGEVSLTGSFLALYQEEEELVHTMTFERSFFHITKYVYFFALLLVVGYNIYVWFPRKK